MVPHCRHDARWFRSVSWPRLMRSLPLSKFPTSGSWAVAAGRLGQQSAGRGRRRCTLRAHPGGRDPVDFARETSTGTILQVGPHRGSHRVIGKFATPSQNPHLMSLISRQKAVRRHVLTQAHMPNAVRRTPSALQQNLMSYPSSLSRIPSHKSQLCSRSGRCRVLVLKCFKTLSISISIYLSLSLSLYLSIYLPVYLFLPLLLSISPSPSLSLSLSLSLPPSLSLALYLSLAGDVDARRQRFCGQHGDTASSGLDDGAPGAGRGVKGTDIRCVICKVRVEIVVLLGKTKSPALERGNR